MLSPDAWHDGFILLEALLQWFQIWHIDAPGRDLQPRPPHLPRTTVCFDAVLCETVREAVRSSTISEIDRVGMVKWLLLPFQMRKDMLDPFVGGQGATAHACWICTVQVLCCCINICSHFASPCKDFAQHIFGDCDLQQCYACRHFLSRLTYAAKVHYVGRHASMVRTFCYRISLVTHILRKSHRSSSSQQMKTCTLRGTVRSWML